MVSKEWDRHLEGVKMSKVLVTGGSGFLGDLFVKEFVKRGESVINFDILEPPEETKDVEFFKGDITNTNDLEKVLEGVDYVCHNAALVPVTNASKEEFYKVNAYGTQNLLNLCEGKHIKKIVHISSSAVFGVPARVPIDLTVIPNPVEDYGKSKYKAEEIAKEFMCKGLNIVIIRPRTVIGPGRLGIFHILFDWIKSGKRIYILGDGSNRFQFVHCVDLINASVKAMYSDKTGIYHVGAVEYKTLREDLEELIRHAGTDSKVVGLPIKPAVKLLHFLHRLKVSPLVPYHYAVYQENFFYDVGQTQKELNWQSRYSNAEALIDAYDWYIKNEAVIAVEGNISIHKRKQPQKILRILKWVS